MIIYTCFIIYYLTIISGLPAGYIIDQKFPNKDLRETINVKMILNSFDISRGKSRNSGGPYLEYPKLYFEMVYNS
jgi:hypothetical protein